MLAALINGQINNHAKVSILERGFCYGDGLFETILVKNNQAILLNYHLERLCQDAQRLGFRETELEVGVFEHEIQQLLACSPDDCIIKIMLTRGIGGRGYNPVGVLQATRVVASFPFVSYPKYYYSPGVKVRICATRLARQPQLAGIKHLNRLEQVLARAEWQDSEIAEGIVLDTDSWVIEGTFTNLFIIDHVGNIKTPRLSYAGVKGVMRRFILETAHIFGLKVIECDLSLSDLEQARSAFLTNSIIGLWPIASCNDWHYLGAACQTTLKLKQVVTTLINPK
ncbi:Aminodeoxychorismate lyase [Piscirickettsia salmonis]|uniref:Aminodeoxychorismate lyase n=1 Tax=Piscirickettsia salmonis TaxID=1238 RepID=A0A1L6TDQ9_PISSA|nr:aminodeoxychorismate lyase [Piscirickettsia salmonis]AKP74571.1 4-amino-4-deoxychorismate lyase [Piscirickettsia salmonis LF-89 = ATCC VR-1361]ALB23574.1 aminodeoxychorismate lyase [Piscirickettsia salmonis]ALY03442.1 4-amino-4-deoxychorismate lyase [Piscirickettsia salmonis]AMA43006.1 4-amino-4-deoxychorismate lyase [Piscirickettsia salmonis]AOS35476.1 4-amino-4-deoxychorismate lyase [Piscirickettsia salmonis]